MTLTRLLFLLAIAHIAVWVNAKEIGITTVDGLIAATPDARNLNVSASGSLETNGPEYRAQLVQLDQDYPYQQILIFRMASNGEYVLADQSKQMDYMGGSGNWKVQSLEFRDTSLFVTFGGHWHQCSHSYTSQFRLQYGALHEVGVESWEENVERNLVVRSSMNFLTGKAYSISGSINKKYTTERGKKRQYRIEQQRRPFSKFDGSPYHLPYYKEHPVC